MSRPTAVTPGFLTAIAADMAKVVVESAAHAAAARRRVASQHSFAHVDAALAKLASRCPDDAGVADLVLAALVALDIDRDERKAVVVLMSILFEDSLAEAIDGRL